MNPYNDAAGNRSNCRVRAAKHDSAARLDAELVNYARKIGHHGVANFVEFVRQRTNAQIGDDYARDVLSRGGFQNPKP